jgi:DNA-binding PadR family transcriptional regulator
VARDLFGFGRFSEPALLILISLADGPKHGYAMMEDVARTAAVRLGAGTLYGALARLERRGLIAPAGDDAYRRPYRLTDAGAKALRAQLGELRDLAALGLRRLEAVS